jgi:hypothetical protein
MTPNQPMPVAKSAEPRSRRVTNSAAETATKTIAPAMARSPFRTAAVIWRSLTVKLPSRAEAHPPSAVGAHCTVVFPFLASVWTFCYSGPTVDHRRTWCFGMTLRFSRHQYVEFVFEQSVITGSAVTGAPLSGSLRSRLG